MKVRELIEKLEEFGPDKDVVKYDDYWGEYPPVQEISTNMSGEVVIW